MWNASRGSESNLALSDHKESNYSPTKENGNSSSETPSFRCLECLHVFNTWTKLTQHLDTTKHFSAKCAVCGQQLKCYGPTHPCRHETATEHSGFCGIFYVRNDYQLDFPPVLTQTQYRCDCQVTFLTPLQLAYHMRKEHNISAIPDEAKCLTCNVSGTLEEMVKHRLGRMRLREIHLFELSGFFSAPYIVSRPNMPQWLMEKKPYAILYQCPVCTNVFCSWNSFLRHVRSTELCLCMLSDYIPSSINSEDPSAKVNSFLPENFEVLLDTSDQAMLELIELDSLSRNNSGGVTDRELMLAYQCPRESCAKVFLTHGELLEHIKAEDHCSFPHDEANMSIGDDALCRRWKFSDYEVTCTVKELVDIFGFSRCSLCGRVLSPGSELLHQQRCGQQQQKQQQQ